MNKEDCLTKLTEFKDLLVSLDYVSSIEQMTSIRSEINKKKHITMKIMSKAHTLKTVTIGSPPAVGGMIMKNLNPLDIIFDTPYGCSIIPSLIDMLDETIGAIEEDDNFFLEDRIDKTRKETKTRKIFIVHGHDDTMKLDVSNVLRQLDFEPIILNDKASGGKTIIEKIETYSDVGFAVILMSPCDVGYKKGEEYNAKPRARQNVIAELGYFVGLLGRNKTFILKKDEVEEPSDFSGIVYEPYDSKGAWKMQLVKELKEAGFSVDANKIM